MTTTTSTMYMDPQIWTGKIFNGDWIKSTGGEYAVVEPATGTQLGVAGQASLEDVRQAAEQAAEAQKAWAQAPFDLGARILRRAGQIWEEQAADIQEWIIRESGSTVPKTGFELHVAASECYEAAGLASQPYGQLIRSEEPRLSLVRRLPVGVVGGISPFNAPVILSIRPVAPARTLGNPLLLQPAPPTPSSSVVALPPSLPTPALP